ncbi:sensor histidine kinase [Rhizobium halophytocola]|uniref:histidine kinase n=1 Tax=Rhizobium halophytocola TaxID=735519 RepID=A0ABS4E0J5_9HYPH|nr:CHASE3 domain-containing protein [Rhizobium halophytocola]MBP1851462.1 signal transduction histidine kinase [Rhizobium halophytocola]
MSANNATFVRSTLLMLAMATALLLAIVVSSLYLVDRNGATFDQIEAERLIGRSAADLLQTLTDAETGQRGYIIARDDSFLAPYEDAQAEIARSREELAKSVDGHPALAGRMSRLNDLVDKKLNELVKTLNLAKTGQDDEAVAVIKTEYGRQLMDQIREILDSFKDRAEGNASLGVRQQRESNDLLRWITIGSALAIAIVMSGAIFVIAQHVRALSQARREVEALNEGLEERVNERTEDLIKANQEIQRFAYIVTHDLRAPLVNVMGFTAELETSLQSLQAYVLADDTQPSVEQIKEARLAASEDLPEAIAFIRSSTKKMDGLINAILKISRDGKRQLKPEHIGLTELMERTAESVYHQVTDAGGEISVDAKVKTIVTDRFSLEQILGNLFDNAVKYKHPERPLNLTVRSLPDSRGMMRIEVEDNGRGIADADHERIFELFRRSGTQDQTGEGIGLAHVQSLARNLGGDITVRSQLNEGSTFVLRLPPDLTRVVRSG